MIRGLHFFRFLMSLFYWNLVDAALVTSAFKLGREERLNHCNSLVVGDEAAWHCQHVGVVVTACE